MTKEITDVELEATLRQSLSDDSSTAEGENTTDNTETNQGVSDNIEDIDSKDEIKIRGKNKTEERFKKLLSKLSEKDREIDALKSQKIEKKELAPEINKSNSSIYDEYIEFDLIAENISASAEEKRKAWLYAKSHPTLPFEDCFVLTRHKNGDKTKNASTVAIGTAPKNSNSEKTISSFTNEELEKEIRKSMFS